MGVGINIFGPALVSIAQPLTPTEFSALGWTRNGVNTTDESFFVNVPGDQYGGDEGPPIDVQYMGSLVRLRLELTKWDDIVANLIRQRTADNMTDAIPRVSMAGYAAIPGTLMIGGSQCMIVQLQGIHPVSGVTTTALFPLAIPREAIEINHGTKYSTFVCGFECHRDPTSRQIYSVTAS